MWRTPAEETVDLYPGLVVHDGRVAGSITAGRTRLPLWAFVPWVAQRGWGDIEDNYPSAAEVGERGLAGFLYDLLEARGEFGRLLLTIANAHRADMDRADAALDAHWEQAHGPDQKVCDCGVPDPPGWWEDEELYGPVRDQLQRCLALLDQEGPHDRTDA